MSGITMSFSLSGRCVVVQLPQRGAGDDLNRALLLSAAGVRLKTFPLSAQENVLHLEGFEPGTYSLHVETGDEIMVQQIILPQTNSQ